MALEPLTVKVEVAGVQQIKQLCEAMQRFADEVEGVEQFLRLKATQERLVCANQLKSAREDFQSLLNEVGAT